MKNKNYGISVGQISLIILVLTGSILGLIAGLTMELKGGKNGKKNI